MEYSINIKNRTKLEHGTFQGFFFVCSYFGLVVVKPPFSGSNFVPIRIRHSQLTKCAKILKSFVPPSPPLNNPPPGQFCMPYPPLEKIVF